MSCCLPENNPIGMYVHVPFCIRKCHYCDFYSLPLEAEQAGLYTSALKMEMEMRSSVLLPEAKYVTSIYVGGGTPTSLSVNDLAEMFENIFSYYNIDPGAEITVEANPGTLGREKLSVLRSAGVNRLSIGFQSCQQVLLDTLGRIHTYPGAVQAFREARKAGFDNINVDLIFGIPGQSYGQWKECLERVAQLRPDHISAYGLHLEEGTSLHERVCRGELEQCREDLEADMYSYLIDYLHACGYIHYEISNFALPGRPCRHNLLYWRNCVYLGVGPSAHSYIGGRRFANIPDLRRYAERLESGILPVDWEEDTDRSAEMSETAFLGLRLIDGLDAGEFRKRFGLGIGEVYGEAISRLSGQGLIEMSGDRVRLTKRGLMLGNRVFAEFV